MLQYLVEAGSGPGAANIARVLTGNAAPGLIAQGVPNGSYYIRVRAVTPSGVGEPSGDASFVVGQSSGGCVSTPLPPTTLAASVTGATVQLTWSATAGACAATHYVVQAGSAPGLSNLAQMAVGVPSLMTNAPSGTYYVRVIAVGGGGQSAASNEIIVRVP